MSAQPPPTDAGEHLFLELDLHHSKILLGVYYSPSLRINYFSSLEVILENLVPSYSHTIVMGDFNTCLLKNDSRSSSLYSVLHSNMLSVLPLSATHHFPNSIPSLLDLIFVSSLDHVDKHGQCSADSFSYHDLLFLSYKIRTPKARPKIIKQRSFRGMNVENLRRDANSIDWATLFNSTSIDDQVYIFNTTLNRLYDVHAPIRTMRVKHLPSPWLTEEIKNLLVKKATAKSKYKRRPTSYNLDKYVAIRNHCSKVCRNAQRRHIHNSVANDDPAQVWKFLRTLGIGKPRQNSLPTNLNLDLLNQHFSASSQFEGTLKNQTLKKLTSVPIPDQQPFVFSQVTACGVKKSILSVTSNAVGSDCISRNMILPILDEILPAICHILNFSLSNSVFPSAWREAQVIPLPKKTNPSSFSDYRPISILPFLSKVLERLIYYQLNTFLSKNNLLNPLQSGFRSGHSTTTALVHITDDIRSGMENGKLTVLALLDFSNAFNTVDFDVLLAMLRSLNISPTTIGWFRTYLFGRRQRIQIEHGVSSWCDLSAGVPQGGVLSPLLFSIFINSISSHISSSYHLYADDLQIYNQAPFEKLTEGVLTLNSDLERICAWSKAHGLKVNPSKTQVIVVGSSRMISKIDWSLLPQVTCDGINVPFSDNVKNLGIYIDKTLSWSTQLQEISRKIFASLGSLRRLRNFLPISTKTALAQSLLLPILDYADASYVNITEDQLNKLERLQNVCIKFVFGFTQIRSRI